MVVSKLVTAAASRKLRKSFLVVKKKKSNFVEPGEQIFFFILNVYVDKRRTFNEI